MVAKIEIEKFEMTTTTFKVIGLTSLICNRVPDEVRANLPGSGIPKNLHKRYLPTSEEQFQNSLYPINQKKGIYGFPAIGFKLAAVRAAKLVGIPMTDARQLFHIVADHDDLSVIDGTPTSRSDVVRVSNSAVIHHRGEFVNWSANLTIRHNETIFSRSHLISLFDMAGATVGVGDWRPEKSGTHGTFEVFMGDK